MDTQRRSLLRAALGLTFGGLASRAIAADCAPATPPQTEGPFYPVRPHSDTNWDLTFVEGGRGRAAGDVVLVTGAVTDQDCSPVAGALVEIWQACASGRYDHPGDDSGLELDPHFQYWGRVLSDDQGRYLFKTIIPGDYPAGPGWQRPPHIHFKVTKRGFRELTTQMYFAGNPLNDRDQILAEVPEAERASVVIPVQDADPASGLDERFCRFDLGVRRF
jgi:protocatechuate 3,4-dioxygenase beta subunit